MRRPVARQVLRVTQSQVEAARLLVELDEAEGRAPSRVVQRIAQAEPADVGLLNLRETLQGAGARVTDEDLRHLIDAEEERRLQRLHMRELAAKSPIVPARPSGFPEMERRRSVVERYEVLHAGLPRDKWFEHLLASPAIYTITFFGPSAGQHSLTVQVMQSVASRLRSTVSSLLASRWSKP